MTKYLFITALSMGAASSAVLTTAVNSAASVFERRVTGASCRASPGYAANLDYLIDDTNGAPWASGSVTVPFFCPVPEDTCMQKTNISTLNVHVEDHSTTSSVYAWACVTYSGSAGGACGNYDLTSASGTGNAVLHPECTKWGSSYSADFPWVAVWLPPYSSAGSSIHGFYISGTPGTCN